MAKLPDDKPDAGNNKPKAPGEQDLISANSQTTIYRNALEHLGEETEEHDPEVTFNLSKQNRESTSSEEHIDTSDELIDMDTVMSERFIADCTKEAKGRKTSGAYPERGNLGQKAATSMIRATEARC